MISRVISEDAGIQDDEAHLLGMGLVGMAHVSARHWMSTGQDIPKDAAEQLLSPAGLARHQRLAAHRVSCSQPGSR